MELNGLQIGNYIQDSESKRIGSITRFRTNLITCKMKFSSLEQHKDYYSPIKPDPHILVELGLQQSKDDKNSFYIDVQEGHGVIHDFKLVVFFNTSSCNVFFSSDDDEILECRINFIHELQNLFKLITNADLQFVHGMERMYV